jgi:apolipoprotein N-acyltransferase
MKWQVSLSNQWVFPLLMILSGFLLGVTWMDRVPDIFLFVGFIPLLFVEEYIYQRQKPPVYAFLFASLAFVVWNTMASWWIWNATPVGCVATIIINTTLMSFTFWLSHITGRKLGRRLGRVAFVIYWLGYEYFSLNTDLSWPWLNLGNGLANSIRFIQWYEYTGVLGGSLWILLVNQTLFDLIRHVVYKGLIPVKSTIGCFLLILVPSCISLARYQTLSRENEPVNYGILLVQPNFDPYLDDKGNLERAKVVIHLASPLLDSSTCLLVTPETTFRQVYGDNLNQSAFFRQLEQFLSDHRTLTIVSGVEYLEKKTSSENGGKTAGTLRYRKFDSAISLGQKGEMKVYHKSKLVPGVEKIPYPRTLGFLGRWMVALGGISESLGTQSERSVFTADSAIVAGPIICYESAYGEHVTGFVKKGANLLLVMTNDGWWGNTPGYRQHLALSRLRAIETRRTIVRAANTGISCFISQTGVITEATPYWTATALRKNVTLHNDITLYTRLGDYIGRIASFFSLILLLYTLTTYLMKK